MTWHKFWVKQDNDKSVIKRPKKKQLLDMDFFCQMTYMAAIATSGIPRSGLFEHAAKLPYTSAGFFKKVVFVAKAFNHDFAEACNIVGQETKEPEAKSLLLRLSGALSSGEDIPIFLERESRIFSESYGERYERSLEILRKWGDAYVAMIMTTAIVIVMAVVSLMIGNVTATFVVGLSVLTIFVTISGAWFIAKSVPNEAKVHSLPCRSALQNIARGIFKFTLPLEGILIIAILIFKIDLGLSMIIIGMCMFPLGLVSWIDDGKIDKYDADIAGFLRSLGGVSQAIGATVTEAMGRLDFHAMGSLKESVDLLYTRLLAKIDPDLCWDRFVGETGSEQVSRSVRIFRDGVTLGGKPEIVGNEASSFAMKVALLRIKRKMIAGGLVWLTIIMHAVLTVLVIFIYRTLISFSDLVGSIVTSEQSESVVANVPNMMGAAGVGNSAQITLLYIMIITIVIVLTFANAYTVYVTGGGHVYIFAFYLAITMVISGAVLIFVPYFVDMMFLDMA